MPDIEHSIEIAAPPDRIWPALTTAKGLAGWWTLGETVLTGEPDRLESFTFQSRAVTTRMQVVALDPPRRVSWAPLESNAPGGWVGTTIDFELTPEGGGVRLDFAHRGFAEDEEGYRKVTAGWAHYLQNLKRFVEDQAQQKGDAA